MKFCYIDESGTGNEPYAVMVGVIVDSTRMHVTKAEWDELLEILSHIVGRPVREFHTRRFYAGRGIWGGVSGHERANIITAIIRWLVDRRHHIVLSSVDVAKFNAQFVAHRFSGDIGSLWRMLGLHLALAIQKNYQRENRNKGNTVLIFDHEAMEQDIYTQLILNPPNWTETYYNKNANSNPLCQIVDVPHFVNSEHVGLIQVADLAAFTLRRYIELTDGGDAERYNDERNRITGWSETLLGRLIPKSAIYPARERCDAADFFYEFAPECIKTP